MEWFNIADSLILSILKDGSYKLLTPYVDLDLETMRNWKRLADKKTKNIWAVLKPRIIEQRKAANIAYGCLNGEREAANFFRYGRTTLENTRSIILFTDGLLIPKENPEAPEDWGLFVKLYQEKGLKGLLEHVRSVEKTDPNCWKYPRYKQHDDVAAIGINFS